MLTLESKFAEFIALCVKNGACSDKAEGVFAMKEAVQGFGMPKDGTCKDGFELHLNDSRFPERWSSWVLDHVGKEMDEKCRKYFIDKISNPVDVLQLLIRRDFFTESEVALLKQKYSGKLPTAEKEIRDGIVSLKAAVK